MRYSQDEDVLYGGPGTASAPPPAAPDPYIPPSPSPKLALTQGFTPDYKGLIESDPSYLQAQSAATRSEATSSAQRRAAIRAAMVQYGGDLPSGVSDAYGDIDQSTRDAATGNQNSVLSRLAQSYAQSGQQFRRQLAARGALQSGDLAYGQDQIDRGYGQQRYDAGNAFTSQVTGAVNDYAGVVGQNARDIGTAIGTAESNVYSNPAYRPVTPTYANYDAEMSSAFGKPIYKADDGSWFNSDGNPFDIVSGV